MESKCFFYWRTKRSSCMKLSLWLLISFVFPLLSSISVFLQSKVLLRLACIFFLSLSVFLSRFISAYFFISWIILKCLKRYPSLRTSEKKLAARNSISIRISYKWHLIATYFNKSNGKFMQKLFALQTCICLIWIWKCSELVWPLH